LSLEQRALTAHVGLTSYPIPLLQPVMGMSLLATGRTHGPGGYNASCYSYGGPTDLLGGQSKVTIRWCNPSYTWCFPWRVL